MLEHPDAPAPSVENALSQKASLLAHAAKVLFSFKSPR